MTLPITSNAVGTIETWQRGVTIGIPLYNEEAYIEAAIRSAAQQCEVLIVSDNGSTDRSAEICRALAREYPNLIFVQQTTNIGALYNFKYVKNEARTPYFMWLGGHDLLPQGYVRKLREVLDDDGSSVLAYGTDKRIDRCGNETSHYDYFYAKLLADEQPAIRLHAIIKYLSDCSLMHGLFRTSALKAVWVDAYYLGCDHVLLAKAAVAGKFLYEPTTCLIRRNPRLQDTQEAQLERITGVKQPELLQSSRRDMQKSQYALVVQISQQMGLRALFFRLSARFWLVNRFGPFGKTWWELLFEKVLRNIGRIVIKYKK